MSLQYRADIDGLRAVAVLVVIFFHAGVPGFSGGFVGVDVFFVISGFLITSIILKEIKEEQFSIAKFYERRIRRIFPALFPVIAFSVVVAALLFDPLAFKDFGYTITATTLFSSNILFWDSSGYFDIASMERPLLHTWSLAVEEQFYIFFPLLLIAINRFSKSLYFQWLLGIGLASLITSIYGVYTNQVATFYLVHTRAWELLFGSILALGVIPQLQSNFHRHIFSFVGLGLIVFSVGCYTEATLFPGTAALAPVMGASLIIYSGIGGRTSVISKFLSLKPIVYIGLISYSLYLWHWPLIVFVKYLIFRDLTPLEISGIILATFLIASFSLKFIEQPFRGNQPIIPDRKKLLALSAIVMVIASIIGSGIHFENGMPYRKPEVPTDTDIAADPLWEYFKGHETTLESLHRGDTPSLIGKGGGVPCFAIWGDSHAGSFLPALSEVSNKYGLSGFNITHRDCPPLIGIDVNDTKTKLYSNEVLSFIKTHPKVKTVILAGIWGALENGHRYKRNDRKFKLKDIVVDSNLSQRVALKNGLTRTVNALLALDRQVIIASDVPEIGIEIPKLLWITKIRRDLNIDDALPTIVSHHQWSKDADNIIEGFSTLQNVTIIHPDSKMFDKSGKLIIISNKKILYYDGDHLSTEGSRFVSPVFDDVFRKIAKARMQL